jgi:hypothetical protein
MAISSPQSNQDYTRIEQATEERVAMRNAAAQELVDQPRARAPQKKVEPRRVRLSAYMGPLLVAGLKDFLDLALLGSFPGVGTVITVCCNLLIFLFFLMGSNATVRPKSRFLFQAGGALMFATGVEGLLFGLNFLPVGMGIVVGIYLREKKYALLAGGKSSGGENEIKNASA